jgi:hypothetical protein
MIRKAKHLALLQIMPCLPAWVPRAPLPEEACETWGGPGVPVQQIMRLYAKMAKNHTNTSPVSQEFGHCAEMTHCFVLASAQCTIGITLAVSPRHAQKPQGHVLTCLSRLHLSISRPGSPAKHADHGRENQDNTTLLGIHSSRVANLEVPLPPLEEDDKPWKSLLERGVIKEIENEGGI